MEEVANPEGKGEQTPPKEELKKEEGQELILGRFKSHDELAKSYQELEKKLGTQGDELGKLRQFRQQVEPLLPNMNRQKEPEKDPEIAFWEKPTDYVRQEISRSLEPVTGLLVKAEKNAAKAAYEDFGKYEEEVDAILNHYPALKMQEGVIDKIYKMVKATHIDDIRKEVREELEKETKRKQESFVEEGGSPSGRKEEGQLNKDEKRIAYKLFPDLTKSKAEEEYLKWR